jgi:hypothetical protein
MSCTWHNESAKEILLTKTNGDSLILKEKTCILYTGRDLCVRIEGVFGSSNGPIGITFLPWRGNRWATPEFSIFKGDIRRIICSPFGVEAQCWGQHIDWDSVEIADYPE